MRKLFLLFWALLATTCLWAHDFEVDGIYYNYLDDNNVAVTYRGSSYGAYNNEYSGEVTIPETVTYNGTTYSVTSIGSSAFWYCSTLTSITIPNSVTSIGYSAFYNCSYLISITIPNSVTSIGSDAFFGTYIYNYESNWRDGVLYISNCLIEAQETISGAYTINNNTQVIADRAFSECYSLTSITIPNSVTSIGYSAFDGCYSLTSITIPNSVTSIGDYAFQYCSSLTSITIPNSVTSIGDGAFSWCSSLTSITIPNSVTNIGYDAFRDCSSLSLVILTAPSVEAFCNGQGNKLLCYAGCHASRKIAINGEIITSITIPNSVTSMGDYAFYGCSSLSSVSIPNSVTNIGNYAFSSCSSLTSITIPNSVTSIGYEAFRGCSSLSSVTIPNSVTSIGEAAFRDCSSLTSITIPNSVTSIGYMAFYDCSALNSIRVEATRPPQLGGEAVSASICYIPCGATFAYELSDWGYCVDVFVEVGCDICGDDLRWEYNNTQLSITGYGEMYDYDIDPQPWQESRNKITQLSLPDGMTSVGAAAFADCKFLNNATIPSSVKEIRYSAFEDCRSLSSLTFVEPSALTSIGNWAFYNCHKLQHVTIPEGVTEIGEAAFFDCTYLSELTLPATMEYIADNGFGLCAKLKRINVSATTPPAVEARTFEDVDRTIPVVVPDESVSVYKSAPVWQEFNIVGKNNVPSAVDNVDASNRSTKKLLRDGNLVIIRDGVEYNVMGQKL